MNGTSRAPGCKLNATGRARWRPRAAGVFGRRDRLFCLAHKKRAARGGPEWGVSGPYQNFTFAST